MPLVPYWFEPLALWFPWLVPCLAIAGLWFAHSTDDKHVQRAVERVYFATMLVVAWGTLRTIVANEGCWLLHTASLCLMILGPIVPIREHSNGELDGEALVPDSQ